MEKWEQSGSIIYEPGKNGATICAISEPRASIYAEYHPLKLDSPDFLLAINNAKLIVAAVNACIEINPENPMAVSDQMKKAFEVIKLLTTEPPGSGDEWLQSIYKKSDEILSAIRGK